MSAPSVPRLTKEDLKQRLDGAAAGRPTILDVRLKYPYEHSTIMLPGAVRMPSNALSAQDLPRDRDLVLYDSDPDDLVSERAAWELIRLGYRAFVLEGGISAWANAKFPTDSKPAPQPSSGAAAPRG
jgi:rhodanese-related sulfurtransferase